MNEIHYGLIHPLAIMYATCFLVVIFSILFSSNKRTQPIPLDYDNRWPGYPNRRGDEDYNEYYKAPFGNLPAMVWNLQTGEWIEVTKHPYPRLSDIPEFKGWVTPKLD